MVMVLGLVFVREAESGSFFSLSCTTNYIAELFKQKVLNRSELVQLINSRMAIAKSRHEALERAGKYDQMDEMEKRNAYQLLVIEELRNVKNDILNKQTDSNVPAKEDKVDEKELECLRYDPDALHEDWSPDAAEDELKSLDEQSEKESERLEVELRALQEQADLESPMGWSMSPETKQLLKYRYNQVLIELFNNEVQQLAFALLQAYMSGGATAPILMAIATSLRLKVAQGLMNFIFDLITKMLGKQIAITPSPLIPPQSIADKDSPMEVAKSSSKDDEMQGVESQESETGESSPMDIEEPTKAKKFLDNQERLVPT